VHDDELAIDLELVRGLVARSAPDLAGRPVSPLGATGSSNALFRLGSDLVVRLPRQPGGGATIEKEARWAPYVAAHLEVAVPEVVLVGDPGLGYPERWSITRWIDGEHPAVSGTDGAGTDGADRRGDGTAALARALARVIAQLRAMPVPPEAPGDPGLRWYRGGPLSDIDADVRAAAAECERIAGLGIDRARALTVWEAALAAGAGPAADEMPTPLTPPTPPTWYHGDLLAENLLVRDGRLVAVLDLGGLGIGDPTVDLAGAWEVLDAGGRDELRAALDVDDVTWARARGWMVGIALITFPYYWASMPERCRTRRAALDAALADAPAR
jgi:aminoglycoside phosphotransferase (APT) family kinase protein